MCGFKTLLSKILKQEANLVNRSVGFVRDIIYSRKDTPASDLPTYLIVVFDDTYTGEPFLKIIQKNMDGYQSNL